jgi:hypothetical protein
MSQLNPVYNVLVKQTQSAAISATTNVFDDIDTLGYASALVIFKFGTTTGTSGTATISVSESSAGGGSGYSAISGATSSALTTDSGGQTNKTVAIPLNLIGKKRYLRVIFTVGGTVSSGVLSVVVVLSNPVASPTGSAYDTLVTLV